MDTSFTRLRPRPPAPAVIDPLLEDDAWQLGYLTRVASELPIRLSPDFRARLVTHHLRSEQVIAGRSALFVWGARLPDVHEIYPRSGPRPKHAKVLNVHMHYRDFVRFEDRIVTEPYRSVMDVLQFHGLAYLTDIVDVRAHIDPDALAHRCRATRMSPHMWQEAIAVLKAAS